MLTAVYKLTAQVLSAPLNFLAVICAGKFNDRQKPTWRFEVSYTCPIKSMCYPYCNGNRFYLWQYTTKCKNKRFPSQDRTLLTSTISQSQRPLH